METLPVEIIDKIFDNIFCKNPRGLYGLRGVCKSWKDMVDRCTGRLLKVWCRKCSGVLPENILDDFIQMKLSQSWKEFCSHKLPMPHIARDIYKSMDEFPNLVGNPHFTEICSYPNIHEISSYDVNDKYFAISYSIIQEGELKGVLCIYSLDDLNCCIREYPIKCIKMDFYATDNREFIVLSKDLGYPYSSFLLEFLVNGNLVPTNLPVNDYYTRYVITGNECFILKKDSYRFQHYQWTQNSFKSSTEVQLSFPDRIDNVEIMNNIQILHSNLFVFARCRNKDYRSVMVVFQYQITRQPNGKLVFSDVIIHEKKSSIQNRLQITFLSDNIDLQNTICDFYNVILANWIKKFFGGSRQLDFINVYAHHVVIPFKDKLIILRGSVQQLMDYAMKNAMPQKSICTVIDLKLRNLYPLWEFNYARVIHFESRPQFLVVTSHKAFVVNFIP